MLQPRPLDGVSHMDFSNHRPERTTCSPWRQLMAGTLILGATASRTKRITAEDIEAFARASGDMNPVHLDEAYAATTPFGRRIAHGLLTGSLISAVLGNDLPGPGTIYLSQELKFKAPVYLDYEITAKIELIR